MAGFEIWSEVTTEGTELSGARNGATSGWDTNTAPPNHVINDRPYDPDNNPEGIKVEWHEQNGSENDVDIEFSDLVEILPGSGLKYPRTIRVRTSARSPRHDRGARGWTKVKVIGHYIRYG